MTMPYAKNSNMPMSALKTKISQSNQNNLFSKIKSISKEIFPFSKDELDFPIALT